MNFHINDVIIAIYSFIISFMMSLLAIAFIFSKFDLAYTYEWPIIFACTALLFLPVRKIFFDYMR